MSFELVKAARLLSFNQADGWPAAFKPWEVAKLQGKDETDEADILNLLELDIKKGDIACTVQSERFGSIQDTEEINFITHWPLDFPKPRRRILHVYTTDCFFVTAEAVAQWLKKHGIEPSRYIQAWIQSTEKDTFVGPELATPDNDPLKKRSHKGWESVALEYVKNVFKAGQYSSAKQLYKALEAKVGEDGSPFEHGTGAHRESLFVREIGKPLTLKTLQNAWNKVKG